LTENQDIIAPGLTSGWQFIVGDTVDFAFRSLQRRQCGYVAANSDTLRSLMLALNQESTIYSLAPIWWDDRELHDSILRAQDQVRQQAQKNRAKEGREEIDEARRDQTEAESHAKQRQLRDEYGVRARGLTNNIQEFVKDLAEKRIGQEERALNMDLITEPPGARQRNSPSFKLVEK
jgi:hypothetical protein